MVIKIHYRVQKSFQKFSLLSDKKFVTYFYIIRIYKMKHKDLLFVDFCDNAQDCDQVHLNKQNTSVEHIECD